MNMMIIGSAFIGILLGFVFNHIASKIKSNKKLKSASNEAERVISRAKGEAAKMDRESKARAKNFEIRARKNVETDIQRQKQKLTESENELQNRNQQLDRERNRIQEEFKNKERGLKEELEKLRISQKRAADVEQSIQARVDELRRKLESTSQLSQEEAKSQLVTLMEEEAKKDASKKIAVVEENAKLEAEKKAKKIISLAINRYAGEYVAERVVSVVALPSDEMKGRIIGREGRNIRTLEAACGVDLIVDETPEAVVISGFDPVRREVARRALERLMEDGRVHPSRIEEVVEKVKGELFKSIRDDGEKACFDLGVTNVHAEIMSLIGSLKYRTSYTQNNYYHSIETGLLCGMMASELGLDQQIARRAGLLHDIGKALDHSVEGSHAVIGADFAKRHGETEVVCHAIRAHHEDEPQRTSYAHLVAASDALSGARPGARRSTMESYVRRLEDLESIGNSFDGVIRTFALQAGREVRVMVESSKVTDEQAVMLSRDIARKIEREMSYPGQIKITVVRESRAVEHAR